MLYKYLFIIFSLKLAHFREKWIFIRKPRFFCLKLVKSGQLIGINFDRDCFPGKMTKLKNGLKSVKINFYEMKSSLKCSQKIILQICCNIKSSQVHFWACFRQFKRGCINCYIQPCLFPENKIVKIKLFSAWTNRKNVIRFFYGTEEVLL